MIAELFNALIEWIQQNPHWAYFVVFLVAAGESLLIVGLFLPGVAMMFGIGALVAAGALELGPTLFWGVVGAVVGDGVSFWIGRHFRERLRVLWPLNRYPRLINRGVDFFHRHGGKSVLLARFIGPVRPILPAVAGMLNMPPRRFFLVNVASALLWAPAYILPGVVFGASLGLAAEVAGRLAVLLLVLVSLLWFGFWLVRAMVRYLQPRAGYLLARAQDWSRRHPLLQPLSAALLDPAHPEARGLAVLVLLLGLASLLATWVLSTWLAGVDLFLHEALQELRTPLADGVMVFITALGDTALLLAVLGAGCAWLMVRGRHHAALHWLAAGLCALLLTRALRLTIASPSDHASLSIAVYGFLAVLIARELTPPRRWIPYICVTLVLIPIGFSRLYLGERWFSDVLAGAGVGLACVALLGVAYRRHPARALGSAALIAVVGAVLLAVGGWRMERNFTDELARHAPLRAAQSLDAELWWSRDWRRLSAQRHDLRVRGRQPLNLQYAGDLASLRHALASQGWRTPPSLSVTTALLWLAPQPEPGRLPVLPQVHDGQHDELRLVREAPDGRTLYALRMWPTRWRLQPAGARLWLGSVSALELHQPLYPFSYLAGGEAHQAALAVLHQDVATGCGTQLLPRNGPAGMVLLLRECRRFASRNGFRLPAPYHAGLETPQCTGT